MKKDKLIYRAATAVITLVMLFSIYKMYSPDYLHLKFPVYFRTELVAFKLIGLAVLLVPWVALQVKEWAYAGFGIVLVSASYAHFACGDGAASLEPLIFLAVLAVSNRYLHKLKKINNQPYENISV